jgi:hypothetical protein
MDGATTHILLRWPAARQPFTGPLTDKEINLTLSYAACPDGALPCHALLRAAAACIRHVLGEPPGSRARGASQGRFPKGRFGKGGAKRAFDNHIEGSSTERYSEVVLRSAIYCTIQGGDRDVTIRRY